MNSIFKSSLLLATLTLATAPANAGDVTKDAMKKYHKGEETVAKKAGAGEATAGELASLLKAYEDMVKEAPPKGTKGSWETKVTALITGVKQIQAGGTAGPFKMAVACKACHEVHKGK
jgi:hypothetical protein